VPHETSTRIISYFRISVKGDNQELTPEAGVLLIYEALKGVKVSDNHSYCPLIGVLLVAIDQEPSKPEQVDRLGAVQIKMNIEGGNIPRGPVIITNLSLVSAESSITGGVQICEAIALPVPLAVDMAA
jgi:hypothetical protein